MTFLGKGESRMWITSEVEIPDELIDHLEQGKLVLFVGAGVSMKGKSNLPNFDDLVDAIAKTLYVEKREITEPHDYYLGKIAKTKDVHQVARDLV
ncbi:protein deacetylase, partial [Bacillus thuringiensis]|nr:protein deacetylase [Bacillus thuringiensis]